MGAQLSVANNSSSSIIDSITNTIISTASSCTASALQSQNISTKNVSGNVTISGVTQAATSSVNLTCLQSSSLNSQIQNAIQQSLTQQAQAAVSGQNIGVQASISTNISNAITHVANSITVNSFKNCSANVGQEQNISTGNVGGNIDITGVSQTLTAKDISYCLQNDSNVVSAVNDLSTLLSQTSSSSAVGFLNTDFIIVIAVVAIIGLGAYFYFTHKPKATPVAPVVAPVVKGGRRFKIKSR